MTNSKYINTLNIVYLGSSGSLFGSASGLKARLIARALIAENVNVTIVSKSWNDSNKGISFVGDTLENEGIAYCRVASELSRPSNIVKRNLLKYLLFIREFTELKRINKLMSIDAGILVTRSFISMLFYRFVSKILCFSLVINYMEYGSAMVTRNKFSQKVNDYFYERFTFKLVDAALPISEVLKNLILNVNRDLPVLKTPVLVDMNCFQKDLPKWDYKYFLFCGAAAFIEIIDFIIKSFELVSSKDIKLHLNCFGSPKEIMTLNDRISRSDKSKLIIFTSKLKYNDLINHYKSAIALLIPLRPTLQDKARFPHKIGEYAASGRPIISNNIGEMAYYFIDGKSALLADSYEFESFRDKMNFVINYPKEADRIGNEGRSVAEENFSYKMFGKGLREFLINIKN